MKSIALLVLMFVTAAAFAQEEGPALTRLEAFSTGLHNLTLEFTQVVKSQDGRIQDETSGKAWLQSPNKLRWVYAGDFPETIVADGSNVWIHDEALEQVTIKPQSSDIADTPLLILTDTSQLHEQFLVTELGEFENLQLLELRSRETESQFERILMGIAADGIRMMVMEDAFGQRTEIRFQQIVRNTELDPELFNFTPPEGADVVGLAIPVE
jgi:outer membrane lipoprotein carrier protein